MLPNAAADDGQTQLLARFRDGDSSALESLFLRYEGPVFRFLFGVLKDHHAAEDALQETFVQAIRHADAVAPESLPRLAVHGRLPAGHAPQRKGKRLPSPGR